MQSPFPFMFVGMLAVLFGGMAFDKLREGEFGLAAAFTFFAGVAVYAASTIAP